MAQHSEEKAMTPERVQKLREMYDQATEKPWHAYSASCCPDMGGLSGPGRKVCNDTVGRYGHPMTIEDAELAAAAVNTLPDVLDEIERLRAENEALQRSLAAELQRRPPTAKPERP